MTARHLHFHVRVMSNNVNAFSNNNHFNNKRSLINATSDLTDYENRWFIEKIAIFTTNIIDDDAETLLRCVNITEVDIIF